METREKQGKRIHMPNPSYYPFFVSVGLFVAALGLLIDNPKINIQLLNMPTLCALGLLIVFASIYGWAFEPAADERVAPDPEASMGDVHMPATLTSEGASGEERAQEGVGPWHRQSRGWKQHRMALAQASAMTPGTPIIRQQAPASTAASWACGCS